MRKKTYQIFDIKQLAELEDQNKKRCRQALAQYKDWHENHKAQSDEMAIYYGDLEGQILRNHACQMIAYYWKIRRNFREAFKKYLKENCVVFSNSTKTAIAA